MSTIKVTEETFESTIESGIVLLDFWAAWCGPCRAFAPTFEAASTRHPDVTFAKVDTEAEPGLAAAFRIRAIPTLAVVRDGIVLGTVQGAVPGTTLDSIIAKAREVDMDEVRKSVSQSPSKTE